MTETLIRKSMYLQADPEEVWVYLTQPDKLAEWFHKPQAPLETGSALEMFGTESGDKLIWGEVRAARPHSYLEYTFTVKPMGDAVSLVKWTLEPVPGGTHLSLVHEGLPQGATAFGLTLSLDKGWGDHLARMRDALHQVDA